MTDETQQNEAPGAPAGDANHLENVPPVSIADYGTDEDDDEEDDEDEDDDD